MGSLNKYFQDLVRRVKRGGEFHQHSDDQMYYLVFKPKQIVEVKRQTPAWIAKLTNEGFNVTKLSLIDEVLDIWSNVPLRKVWLKVDSKNPLNWNAANQSLGNALTNEKRLLKRVEEKLRKISDNPNNLLLITDLEVLHPYARISAIEGGLIGKIKIPTIVLYPGKRIGATQLSFLGFYPPDGNYRSTHVGE